MQLVKQTWRRLWRAPLFTVTATVTLALGIAANVAVFSVVSAVLWTPLPFENPGRLVAIWHAVPGLTQEPLQQSAALHFTYKEKGNAFEDTAMWTARRTSVTGMGEPEEVPALLITHEFLPLLGTDAALGRRILEEDDQPNAPTVVMLSHGYWQQRFGGREDALDQTITVNGVPRQIVGVLPRDFDFLEQDVALLAPMQIDRSQQFLGMFNYRAFGRLRDGVTIAQANAEIDRLLPVAAEDFPGGLTLQVMQEAQFAGAVHPLEEDVVGDISQVLFLLLASVGLVLLIACANVANLFLVRSESRQRELAVRSALGAGRGTLIGELLVESLALGAFGGLLGVGLAWALLRVC